MSAYFYCNAVGRRLYLPERSLEPPDCWREEPEELEGGEYGRGEGEPEWNS